MIFSSVANKLISDKKENSDVHSQLYTFRLLAIEELLLSQ